MNIYRIIWKFRGSTEEDWVLADSPEEALSIWRKRRWALDWEARCSDGDYTDSAELRNALAYGDTARHTSAFASIERINGSESVLLEADVNTSEAETRLLITACLADCEKHS